MTMITPSYLGETIEYSSLHACRSTLEDPTLRRGMPRLQQRVLDEAHPGLFGRRHCEFAETVQIEGKVRQQRPELTQLAGIRRCDDQGPRWNTQTGS